MGLSVNHNKTKHVFFTRKRRLDGLYMPTIGSTVLGASESGVTLDAKSNWLKHLQLKLGISEWLFVHVGGILGQLGALNQ